MGCEIFPDGGELLTAGRRSGQQREHFNGSGRADDGPPNMIANYCRSISYGRDAFLKGSDGLTVDQVRESWIQLVWFISQCNSAPLRTARSGPRRSGQPRSQPTEVLRSSIIDADANQQ